MALDPTTQIAAAIAAAARFIPATLFGVLVASVVIAIYGDRFPVDVDVDAAGLALFAGSALLWYLGEESLKKWRKLRERWAGESAAKKENAAAKTAAQARLAGAFNSLPTDAQELLLLVRLAGATRVTVEHHGTIHSALWTCPLVRRVAARKGNVQGFAYGDYYEFDLLDVGIERVDALLAKLKEEEPATYDKLERRVKARR